MTSPGSKHPRALGLLAVLLCVSSACEYESRFFGPRTPSGHGRRKFTFVRLPTLQIRRWQFVVRKYVAYDRSRGRIQRPFTVGALRKRNVTARLRIGVWKRVLGGLLLLIFADGGGTFLQCAPGSALDQSTAFGLNNTEMYESTANLLDCYIVKNVSLIILYWN